MLTIKNRSITKIIPILVALVPLIIKSSPTFWSAQFLIQIALIWLQLGITLNFNPRMKDSLFRNRPLLSFFVSATVITTFMLSLRYMILKFL